MKKLSVASLLLVSLFVVIAHARQQTANTVTIMGEVRKPGMYDVGPNGTLSFIQLLARAGGLNAIAADPRHVTLARSDGQIIAVDLNAILGGKAADMTLQLGDTVIVPDRQQSLFVAALGRLNKPGI
jgi:protein involved in polysaccharide export with SLBB domain